jgi:hypothetical protein
MTLKSMCCKRTAISDGLYLHCDGAKDGIQVTLGIESSILYIFLKVVTGDNSVSCIWTLHQL